MGESAEDKKAAEEGRRARGTGGENKARKGVYIGRTWEVATLVTENGFFAFLATDSIWLARDMSRHIHIHRRCSSPPHADLPPSSSDLVPALPSLPLFYPLPLLLLPPTPSSSMARRTAF